MSRKWHLWSGVRSTLKLPTFKTVLFVFLSISFVFAGFVVLLMATLKIPDLGALQERKVAQSSKIYDRTGKILLYSVQDNTKRTVVPFDEVSRYVKNATVAIEDAEFYQHFGIKPTSILRAVFANILGGGYKQGGSTITQQVVKNTILTTDKTITRKIKEWILAIKLEQVLTKDQILSLYLNEAPYGGNIYGVEEAAQVFFGKHAKDLDLAESAYIAALPQAPTYYSPYGNHRADLDERKNLVLSRMRDLSFISNDEYGAAISEKITFLPQEPKGIKAPHFVTWVMEYLAQKYGEDALTTRGLKVTTTLDYDLQQKAEDVVTKYGNENETKYNAKNAGMVGIDPRTGQVLVMVGSRDYFNRDAEGNFNVTLAHRQPGSSFKPFVYATAFMKGYTPDTVVFDVPTQFQTTCDASGKPLSPSTDPKECYMPENYDGKFRGPMTLRNALAQSINIPAIKVLYLAGIKDSIETARNMGIEGLSDPNRYGLTLVLGGGEVSLLDLTSAYSVFANDGVRNPHESVLKVEDSEGNVLEENGQAPAQVIPKNIALEISGVLSDNTARTPAYGSQSYLYFPGKDVAVKTGTTNDYRDAWIVGYTPSFALGAWVGNNDNTPMEKKVAGFIVAPMWNALMKQVLDDPDYQSGPFEKPIMPDPATLKPVFRGVWQGGESYFVDSVSGKLATEYTPPETKEERVIPSVHDILYWVDKNDPLGQKPEHPEQDPQFFLWEKPVRDWALKQGLVDGNGGMIPTALDDVHTPDAIPKISFVSPANNALLDVNARVFVNITSSGRFPLAHTDFFVNDQLIGSAKNNPFSFSFTPSEIDGIKTQGNELKAVGYDTVFNKGAATISFDISGQNP